MSEAKSAKPEVANLHPATLRPVPAGVEAAGPLAAFSCLRCGFEVVPAPWGCKNPCRNCGFVYPLGDCSD